MCVGHTQSMCVGVMLEGSDKGYSYGRQELTLNCVCVFCEWVCNSVPWRMCSRGGAQGTYGGPPFWKVHHSVRVSQRLIIRGGCAFLCAQVRGGSHVGGMHFSACEGRLVPSWCLTTYASVVQQRSLSCYDCIDMFEDWVLRWIIGGCVPLTCARTTELYIAAIGNGAIDPAVVWHEHCIHVALLGGCSVLGVTSMSMSCHLLRLFVHRLKCGNSAWYISCNSTMESYSYTLWLQVWELLFVHDADVCDPLCLTLIRLCFVCTCMTL